MRTIAKDGARLIVAQEEWDGDMLALGVVVDTDSGDAWEVPIGTALNGGYWREVSPTDFDIDGYTPKRWPGGRP